MSWLHFHDECVYMSSIQYYVCCVQCPVPQLTVTAAPTAAPADADSNDVNRYLVVHASRQHEASTHSDLSSRRLSTPAVSPLASGARLSPSVRRESLGADLPSKPRLDSLFNTHGNQISQPSRYMTIHSSKLSLLPPRGRR